MTVRVQFSSLRHVPRAFTLIELLVVIGIIGVIAGITAFSLGGGTGGGIAVQTAQGNVLSMVSAVRSTAALQNQRAALFVNVDPTTDGFLSELQIGYDTGGGNWRVRGTGLTLPKGVYIVPDPEGAGAGTFSIGGNTSDNVQLVGAWNSGTTWELYSTAMPPATNAVELKDDNDQDIGPAYIRLCELPNVGRASAGNVGQIAVASAKRESATRIIFDNPDSVRGVSVSSYGVSTLQNNAAAMK